MSHAMSSSDPHHHVGNDIQNVFGPCWIPGQSWSCVIVCTELGMWLLCSSSLHCPLVWMSVWAFQSGLSTVRLLLFQQKGDESDVNQEGFTEVCWTLKINSWMLHPPPQVTWSYKEVTSYTVLQIGLVGSTVRSINSDQVDIKQLESEVLHENALQL